jgi:hypothetical protein
VHYVFCVFFIDIHTVSPTWYTVLAVLVLSKIGVQRKAAARKTAQQLCYEVTVAVRVSTIRVSPYLYTLFVYGVL